MYCVSCVRRSCYAYTVEHNNRMIRKGMMWRNTVFDNDEYLLWDIGIKYVFPLSGKSCAFVSHIAHTKIHCLGHGGVQCASAHNTTNCCAKWGMSDLTGTHYGLHMLGMCFVRLTDRAQNCQPWCAWASRRAHKPRHWDVVCMSQPPGTQTPRACAS